MRYKTGVTRLHHVEVFMIDDLLIFTDNAKWSFSLYNSTLFTGSVFMVSLGENQ
jgi:hypothetical protein